MVPLLREVRSQGAECPDKARPAYLPIPTCSRSAPAFAVEKLCGNVLTVSCVYRVTFALEEKNLPYDSVLIELRSKPHWYKDIVPTELTPAAVINGDLVYESLDILKVRAALLALASCSDTETVLPSPNLGVWCCRSLAHPQVSVHAQLVSCVKRRRSSICAASMPVLHAAYALVWVLGTVVHFLTKPSTVTEAGGGVSRAASTAGE